ncbi:MAG: hypothetical protein WCQ99_01420 [Pseudomonadota bacterium]
MEPKQQKEKVLRYLSDPDFEIFIKMYEKYRTLNEAGKAYYKNRMIVEQVLVRLEMPPQKKSRDHLKIVTASS